MQLEELRTRARESVRRWFGGRETMEARPVIEPAMDLLESVDDLVIKLDVPGAVRSRSTVECDGRRGLSVYARREAEADFDWYRRIELPEVADAPRASADMAGGVLTIRVPKVDTARPRRIAVTRTKVSRGP